VVGSGGVVWDALAASVAAFRTDAVHDLRLSAGGSRLPAGGSRLAAPGSRLVSGGWCRILNRDIKLRNSFHLYQICASTARHPDTTYHSEQLPHRWIAERE
jgi:hypothetical protein